MFNLSIQNKMFNTGDLEKEEGLVMKRCSECEIVIPQILLNPVDFEIS
jgi:hypothetical protein